MIIGCLGIVLGGGCGGPEEEDYKSLAEASQLAQAAREAEKPSYADAFNLYQEALTIAEAVTAQYPLSPLADKLVQGEVKIGSSTFTELKDTIVPQARLKAEAEASPLACALGVARTAEDVTVIAKLWLEIADKYAAVGQYDQVLQLVKTAGDATYGLSSQIINEHTGAGQYDQALQVAASIEDPPFKADMLAELASKYTEAGQVMLPNRAGWYTTERPVVPENSRLRPLAPYSEEKAAEILSQALQVANIIEDSYSKAGALVEITGKHIEAEQYDQALQLINTIEEPSFKADLLAQIATKYAEAEYYDQALQLVNTIEDPSSRAETLAAIANKYAQAGHYNHALKLANTIADFDLRVGVLIGIAEQYTAAEQQALMLPWLQPRMPTFQLSNEVAYAAINYFQEKAWHILSQVNTDLPQIAGKYAEAGQYPQALQIANTITEVDLRAEVLAEIARAYAQTGHEKKAAELLSQALKVANTIENVSSKGEVLAEIARKYAHAGHYDQALQIVSTIEDPSSKAGALAEMAQKCMEAGQTEKAAQVLSQVLEVAQTIEDPYAKAKALAGIAHKYTEAGHYDQALQVAKAIGDAPSAARVLAGIAHNYTEAGQPDHALQLASTIVDSGLRAEALAEIARKYAHAGHYDQALQVATIIEDPSAKAQALAGIAHKRSEERRVGKESRYRW